MTLEQPITHYLQPAALMWRPLCNHTLLLTPTPSLCTRQHHLVIPGRPAHLLDPLDLTCHTVNQYLMDAWWRRWASCEGQLRLKGRHARELTLFGLQKKKKQKKKKKAAKKIFKKNASNMTNCAQRIDTEVVNLVGFKPLCSDSVKRFYYLNSQDNFSFFL